MSKRSCSAETCGADARPLSPGASEAHTKPVSPVFGAGNDQARAFSSVFDYEAGGARHMGHGQPSSSPWLQQGLRPHLTVSTSAAAPEEVRETKRRCTPNASPHTTPEHSCPSSPLSGTGPSFSHFLPGAGPNATAPNLPLMSSPRLETAATGTATSVGGGLPLSHPQSSSNVWAPISTQLPGWKTGPEPSRPRGFGVVSTETTKAASPPSRTRAGPAVGYATRTISNVELPLGSNNLNLNNNPARRVVSWQPPPAVSSPYTTFPPATCPTATPPQDQPVLSPFQLMVSRGPQPNTARSDSFPTLGGAFMRDAAFNARQRPSSVGNMPPAQSVLPVVGLSDPGAALGPIKQLSAPQPNNSSAAYKPNAMVVPPAIPLTPPTTLGYSRQRSQEMATARSVPATARSVPTSPPGTPPGGAAGASTPPLAHAKSDNSAALLWARIFGTSSIPATWAPPPPAAPAPPVLAPFRSHASTGQPWPDASAATRPQPAWTPPPPVTAAVTQQPPLIQPPSATVAKQQPPQPQLCVLSTGYDDDEDVGQDAAWEEMDQLRSSFSSLMSGGKKGKACEGQELESPPPGAAGLPALPQVPEGEVAAFGEDPGSPVSRTGSLEWEQALARLGAPSFSTMLDPAAMQRIGADLPDVFLGPDVDGPGSHLILGNC